MRPSRYNLVSTVHASGDRHYVVNPLSQAADLVDNAELAVLQGTAEPSPEQEEELVERGYLVEPDEEDRRARLAYLDFVEARDADEVQIFFVPTYACNFNCSYCYQAEYGDSSGEDAAAAIDAFFAYVDTNFAERKKYITLFGGEPLLAGQRHRALIAQFVERVAQRGLELAVVTNGYHLTEYLDLLSHARLREIQVTLDGVGSVHDQRRMLHGGGSTFEKIVDGIDAALAREFPINLRVVLDRENAAGLVELGRFAMERGWTRHEHFKTQLGRNYELHACQADRGRLYDRLELGQFLFDLLQQEPWMQEFVQPNFSVAKALRDTGELPAPLFDACPGCKTEWAFDIGGGIYSCTATVGKSEERLGTFWPRVTLDQDAVEEWEDRDVLAIEECRSCQYQLLCGGGCGSIAKNRHGRLHAPDCRPIGELLDMGMALYVTPREDE